MTQETIVKHPVTLYTEQTPNPETLKFVTNRMLFAQNTADFRDAESAKEWSPMATALFELPYVKGVYISNNFVTISKEFNYDWADIMLKLKSFIKDYIESEKTILNDGYAAAREQEKSEDSINYSEDDAAIVVKIKELIATYVKPAVEMDGGNIEFASYVDGVVSVVLQGACSGCPSSTVTLKSGIEGMMKRMIPEVTEVVAIAG